jgi:hypothetical protein
MGIWPSLRRPVAVLVGSLSLLSCEPERPTVADAPPPSVQSGPRSTYTYERFGVTAVLHVHASGGLLEVTNRTGSTLGRPGIVVLEASDGRPHAMDVRAPTPITDTESVAFTLSPHRRVEPARIGLILLSFGSDGYGALVPSGGPQ